MHFGKTPLILILLMNGLLLTSCGDDQLDIPETPLQGQFAGEAWNFKFGNGNLYSTDGKYRFLLFSDEEVGDDPCTLVGSTRPHLAVILPIQEGSYSLPITPQNENLKFIFGDGKTLSATSGFIEIFGIDNARLVGYMQAIVDEDNSLEGRFIIELC